MNKKQTIVVLIGAIISFVVLVDVTMMFGFICPRLLFNTTNLSVEGLGSLIAWELLVLVLKDKKGGERRGKGKGKWGKVHPSVLLLMLFFLLTRGLSNLNPTQVGGNITFTSLCDLRPLQKA